MPELPLSSLLGGDGTALVGEAATLEFTLKYVPNQPAEAKPLSEVFDDVDFTLAVQESMQTRVQKEFGKEYFIDKLDINPTSHTIKASISTLLDEDVSLQGIAKKTAATTQAVRKDLLYAATRVAGAKPWVQVSWGQGEGLFDPHVLSADTPSPQLEARLATLRKKRHRLRRRRAFCFIAGLVLISFLLMSSLNSTSPLFPIVFYGILFLGAAIALTSQISDLDSESQEVGTALDLRQVNDEDPQSRPEKLFREHSFELKRYYDQTLSQGRTIYFVGLGCLLLGFAVIGVSLWLVIEGGKTNSEEKVIVGALGAIGGILADYIAVVYLKMFSETIHAVTDFHRRFVVTHHLHFGNVLASMIGNTERREETLARMAERVAASGRLPEQIDFAENGKSAAVKTSP